MAVKLYLSPSLETSLLHTVERIGEVRSSHPLLPINILVPTAQTVQAVRQLLGDTIGVSVNQFYGLGQAILDAAGQPARWLNDTTIRRLVHALLGQMNAQGALSTFSAVWDMPGFNHTMVDWLREMKTQGIPPEDYDLVSQETGLPRDIQLSFLYAQYQRFLQEANLSDADGLLWLAAEGLEHAPDLFKNRGPIFILGFDQFNPIQERILSALANRFGEFSVYLPWNEHLPDTSLALTRLAETRKRLKSALPEICETHLTELEQVAPALQLLRRTLFENDPRKEEQVEKLSVRANAAPSREIEVRLALREIKRLLLQGVSPGEIVLLAPQPAVYQRLVDLAAEEYGVPVILDRVLASNPFVQTLINLVALSPDFPRRETLEALRCPYVRQPWLTEEQMGQLEKLSRERPVLLGRDQWIFALEPRNPVQRDELQAAAENLVEEEEDLGPSRLSSLLPIDELRSIQAGLIAFFDHLTPPLTATYREYTLWLQERILGLSQPMEEETDDAAPRPASLDLIQCASEGEYAERDLGALGSVLQQLGSLVDAAETGLPGGSSIIPWAVYRSDLLNTLPALVLPPDPLVRGIRFDRLEAGREQPVDYLFLLGLSEGEFPSPPPPDPLYSLVERQKHPLPLRRVQPAEAGSLFWLVISNCRKGLFLFRPRLDDSGTPWQPSPFWEAVLEKIPVPVIEVPVAFVPAVEQAAGPAELLTALAMNRALTVPPELAIAWQAARHGFEVMRLRSSWIPAAVFEGHLLAPDLLEEFISHYNPDFTWSPSRLNRYGACPFGFFAQSVLQLEEWLDPEEGLDAMRRGSLLHAVLEHLYRGTCAEGLALTPENQETVIQHLDRTCDQLFPRAPERYGFRPNALWRYEQQELRRLLRALIVWECNQVTTYHPYQQELRFGVTGGTLPRYLCKDSQGTEFYLHGVIDRVDRDANSGALRVLDYKSGSTPYSLQDILAGRALQAPLYALAAEGLLGERVLESAYLLIPKREFSGKISTPDGAAASSDVQAALDQAGKFVRDIRRGVFPSLPSNSSSGSLACSSYCEYTNLCRVDRQVVAKARRAVE